MPYAVTSPVIYLTFSVFIFKHIYIIGDIMLPMDLILYLYYYKYYKNTSLHLTIFTIALIRESNLHKSVFTMNIHSPAIVLNVLVR